MCETQKKTTIKEVKMHKLSVCASKSQDFAKSQKKFALILTLTHQEGVAKTQNVI